MKKNVEEKIETQELLGGIDAFIGSLIYGSVEEILSAIGTVLRRPVVLFSPNLQVISTSEEKPKKSAQAEELPQKEKRSPMAEAIASLGYHPDFYDMAPKLTHGNIIIRDENKRVHIYSDKEPFGGEVFAPIIADNATREILGYLYFYEPYGKALFDNRNYLSFICHSLSWRMWKYTHTIEKSNALLTDILCNVLDGTVSDDALIQKALTRAKVHIHGNYMLFVISSGTNKLMANENPTQRWSDLFKAIWSGSIAFMYNGDLVLLVHANEPEDFAQTVLPLMKQRLAQMHCCGGYSEIFHELDHYLMHYYTRSLAAVHTAVFHEEYACVPYEDVALEHIFRFGKIATSRAVVDPRLLRMLAADSTYSSNYVETLRIYWTANKNVETACEKLHIQRSTFFYRLKKIKEYLGEDFQHHKPYLQYNVSLTILEKLGELDPLNEV